MTPGILPVSLKGMNVVQAACVSGSGGANASYSDLTLTMNGLYNVPRIGPCVWQKAIGFYSFTAYIGENCTLVFDEALVFSGLMYLIITKTNGGWVILLSNNSYEDLENEDPENPLGRRVAFSGSGGSGNNCSASAVINNTANINHTWSTGHASPGHLYTLWGAGSVTINP